MSYNGWKNKETWLVGLWLGDMFTSDQEDDVEISEEHIRESVEFFVAESGLDGFLLDMLNASLSEIDYRELAAHYFSGPVTEG